MTRQTVYVDSRPVLLSMDDPTPLGSRLWTLVRGRVLDETSGEPPRGAISLETDVPGCTPRVGADGLVGLLGIPGKVFGRLAGGGYGLEFRVQVEGYVPRRVPAVLPTDPRTFTVAAPADATAVSLDDVSQLSAGEFLLVGPPGPALEQVRIRALGPGPGEVTVAPPLVNAVSAGDPAVPVVPDDFGPANLGEIPLHPQPVDIAGRVVQVTAMGTTPLAAATVAIIGLWRTAPSAGVAVPADPPNLIWLQPPLSADRETGVGQLAPRSLPGIVELPPAEKRLLSPAAPGDRVVELSNRGGLNPGDILLVDANHPDRVEFLEVAAIDGGAAPDLPARIGLVHALAFGHRERTLVQRSNPGPAGADRPFAAEGLAGDSCLYLANLGGLADGAEVQIHGGPSPAEYHRIRLYSATSDGDGYYRLPPLSRVAQVEIQATAGPLPPLIVQVSPDYGRRENRLDLRFR
jgi:hypothetical protein